MLLCSSGGALLALRAHRPSTGAAEVAAAVAAAGGSVVTSTWLPTLHLRSSHVVASCYITSCCMLILMMSLYIISDWYWIMIVPLTIAIYVYICIHLPCFISSSNFCNFVLQLRPLYGIQPVPPLHRLPQPLYAAIGSSTNIQVKKQWIFHWTPLNTFQISWRTGQLLTFLHFYRNIENIWEIEMKSNNDSLEPLEVL